MAEEKTLKKRGPGRPFLPDDPRIKRTGRMRGSKNKFGEAFVDAMLVDFEEHGAAVIETCRTKDPSTYIRVAAAILPRQIEQDIELTDTSGSEKAISLDWNVITGGLYADTESSGGVQMGEQGKGLQKPKGSRKASKSRA